MQDCELFFGKQNEATLRMLRDKAIILTRVFDVDNDLKHVRFCIHSGQVN